MIPNIDKSETIRWKYHGKKMIFKRTGDDVIILRIEGKTLWSGPYYGWIDINTIYEKYFEGLK